MHSGLTDDNTCDICGTVFYRPYDVTYTDSTINFKVNVLDRNSEPYTKADCMRFDVFLRANNSGTSYDANMDFDHNGYYNGTEFPIYESPSKAGYCVKDGATYTVVLNASSVDQITDFDEDNPYVWIILRPGMYNNCMDYGGGYSLNMTYANFYNCSVCLGKFGSLKDFQDVKPDEEEPAAPEIISITEKSIPAVGELIDLEVLVSKPVKKLQFIDKDSSTFTYTASSANTVSVVNNDDGTQTWNVKLTVRHSVDEYAAKVKERASGTWSDKTYDLKLEVPAPVVADEICSLEICDMQDNFIKFGTHNIILTTGKDVSRVQVAYAGTTATYSKSSSKVTVEEDGETLIWTIKFNFYNVDSDVTYDFKSRASSGSWKTSSLTKTLYIYKTLIIED